MPSIDMHTTILTSIGLAIADITTNTTTVGAIIDTQGFESLEWSIQSGTITDGTYTPLLEESDVIGFSPSNVLDTDFSLGTIANATFGAADDDTVKRIGTVGKKRFQRLSIVSAGTSTGGTNFGAQAILGHARHQETSGS